MKNKCKIFKGKKGQAGITLVALVVTIVVLLILAGVSLNLVLNNSGIIKKSGEARDKYSDASANEQEQMQDALDWINSNVNGNNSVDWDKVLADATANPDKYKHEDQSSTNGDIGIGTDGKPVNLDLWTYEVINENQITLGNHGGCAGSPGYQNVNIVDGEIQGKVPQYIKINGKDDFFAVTNMSATFTHCTSLTKAPVIPTTVVDMDWTFKECTNLTTAPEISPSVTNMNCTFYECTSLTTAPEIPPSVTNMSCTFSECTSLTTAPEIPQGVTDMSYTFSKCTSLTIAPEIPQGVTDMRDTFWNCTSLTIAPEIPQGVTDMSYTFRDCTSLTTAPEIPQGVTDMSYTFFRCSKLQGNIEINANPTYYTDCFNGAATEGSGLTVTGSSTLLDEIIATGSSNKITRGN